MLPEVPFSRSFLRNFANNKASTLINISINGLDSFLASYREKGHIETLTTEPLHSLHSNQELPAKQETEISSIHTYISDLVNLKNIKSNEALQNRMYWSTVLSPLIAVISIILGLIL